LLSDEDAANLAPNVSLVSDEVIEPIKEVETPVEKMSLSELRKAASLKGLSTSGSKADLLERLSLGS
jgi:hypothetical protein